MPTPEAAALEKIGSEVADALPAGVQMPEVKADFGASEFWKDEPAIVTPPVKETAKVTPPAVAATPPATLAERLAAKVKPVVSVEDATPPVVVKNPEDELQMDPKSSPKARENFENLRTITRAERKRAADAEKSVSDLKAKLEAAAKTPGAVDATELDRLKAEHKTMSDKLLLIDTRNHPAFQNQYVAPRKEALVAATELLKAHGKDADLAALIEKPRGEIGKALGEILKDVPAFDQTEISSHIQKAYQLAQGEKTALANAAQVNGAIKQGDVASHGQAFESTWNRLVGGVTEIIQPLEIPAGLTPEQEAHLKEYNAEVAGLQANARKLATGAASYESIAEASIKAATYDLHVKHVLPRIGAEIGAMQEVIRGLKAEVEGYRSRNPNREIGASPSGGKGGKQEPASIEEAAAAAWK